jgi:hypothetical protein
MNLGALIFVYNLEPIAPGVGGWYPFLGEVKKNHYPESANCADRPFLTIYPVAMAPYTLTSQGFFA